MIYSRFESSFQSLFSGKDKFVKTTEGMSDFILNQYKDSFLETKFKYLFGITLNPSSAVIWYNKEPFHALPLALNTFNRALLKQFAGSECDVFVTNKPYIESKENVYKLINRKNSMIYAIYVTFLTFSQIWPMMFIGFYIKEREMMIRGVNKIIYWMTSYLFDVGVYLVVYSVLFAVVNACVDNVGVIKEPFLVFTVYNVTVLPFIYLVSRAFSKPATGVIFIVFGGYLGELN